MVEPARRRLSITAQCRLLRIRRTSGSPAGAGFGRKKWAEAVPPQSHRLVTYDDASLKQQVLDVPHRQRKYRNGLLVFEGEASPCPATMRWIIADRCNPSDKADR